MVKALLACTALVVAPAWVLAPPAHAEDAVTYEVVSDTVGMADIEYVDQTGRHLITHVPLPWRLQVPLEHATSPDNDGAQVRADWRPVAAPSRWVSARIYLQDKILCQNTLDVGNAACYGAAPRST
jgi:Mycobacterium membrane protein